MSMVRAVLFDVDGVLIDAADWHFEALNLALIPFDATISRDEHEKHFLGLTSATKLDRLVAQGRLIPSVREQVLARKRDIFRQFVRSCCVPDQSRCVLLEQLQMRGLLLAAISNATRESVLDMLHRSGLVSFFNTIVCGDDVSCPKPDREPYLICLAKLNIHAEECLAIEDGQYGIDAAHAAGIRVVKIAKWADLTLSNLGLCRLNILP